MTRRPMVLKAVEGRITWTRVATIPVFSHRQMRRLKTRCEQSGFGDLRDWQMAPRMGSLNRSVA